MSNTNYDVELPITYSDTYKHYIPTYRVKVPYYHFYRFSPPHEDWYVAYYNLFISFDEESEEEIGYGADEDTGTNIWNTQGDTFSGKNKNISTPILQNQVPILMKKF